MLINHLSEKTLGYFYDICKVPRCSGNEKQIAQWLLQWAATKGFTAQQDEIGNVLICVPSKGEKANGPVVVIQGHMDMVCVKEGDSDHNFCQDPIKPYIEEGWMKADKTTLGADNGIAIAISLALADSSEITHPPLELLFTVDEERGLTGANHLEPGFLKGKILLNIDSEEEGEFTIGCAGGKDTHIELPLHSQEVSNCSVITLSISGLIGGHSGMEINEQRTNAIQAIGRLLENLSHYHTFNIITLNGGIAHNAIPRESYCAISVSQSDVEDVMKRLNDYQEVLLRESTVTDKDIQIKIEIKETCCDEEDINCLAYDFISTKKIINLIMSLPHGVFLVNREDPELVETSNNLAIAKIEEDTLKIMTSQRSSVASKNDFLTRKIEAVAHLCGAKAVSGNGYPAWEPNTKSALLARCKETYLKTFNQEAKIKVIHAGLECGIIGAKYEGMEMISIGPNIKTPHSPQERLEVASIDKILLFIVELFKNL